MLEDWEGSDEDAGHVEEFEAAFRPNVFHGRGTFRAGRWTYWANDARFITWKERDSISIGSFCSISGGVQLLAGGNHSVSSVSTYPFTLMQHPPAPETEPQAVGAVSIGHDVWIGTNALVIDTSVGNGAVIGAGAVVVHPIPDFAVAVGCPARVVRMRFSEEQIAALQRLRWWEWPDEIIREAEPLLRSGDISALLQFHASRE